VLKENTSNKAVREELAALDAAITSKFNAHSKESVATIYGSYDEENDDDGVTPEFEPVENDVIEDFDPDLMGSYLTAQVQLPLGDELVLGNVIARKRDAHGNPIGKAADNPIFDTRVYLVQFPDQRVEEYSANMIAENLYSQVDHEGNQFILLDEIIDHVHDETAKPGHNKMNGWKLCVLWKDGSTSWEQLKDLKHGFPVQAAEYAL
jgi:hypothetical protein